MKNIRVNSIHTCKSRVFVTFTVELFFFYSFPGAGALPPQQIPSPITSKAITATLDFPCDVASRVGPDSLFQTCFNFIARSIYSIQLSCFFMSVVKNMYQFCSFLGMKSYKSDSSYPPNGRGIHDSADPYGSMGV